MKCPKCLFDNREGVKFCEECGAKLELVCPVCGTRIPPGRKFCGECGRDLSEPAETVPLDYSEPQSYTPKHLADKILTGRSAIEGERKLVTVLFADVANSTSVFGRLDPEQVHDIMDGCFRILMDEVHRYEGTINQFTGDGVMALFGAPIAHEDHAQRACHASLAIQKAFVSYGEKLERDHGIEFKMRIGLNTGLVVVGAIGDDLRMDYTAQGDTSNLAARMESSAEPGAVLVSQSTYRLSKDFFEFEARGPIQVKGKEEPQKAYVLISTGEVDSRIDASAAKGLTRFVGRKRELETAMEAFDKAAAGHGQVVGIVGEAGVGKSRLLYELRRALPKNGFNYLEGRCIHYGGSMPYLPILGIFRSFIGIKEGDRERVIKKKMRERILELDENLEGAIPPIQELLSLTVDDGDFAELGPQKKRDKTFEAIRDLLIRGGRERPIVLAIEDLHWIDRTSQEFLDYMIDRLPNTRILLLLLYRPEYTHTWGSKSYYSRIGVDQLSSGASTELVRAILEGGKVIPELNDLILSRAAGNPFFMEELTHSLLENGSILKKQDQYVLNAKPSDIHVPDTVQGIIAARMDRLEEGLKRIMQVASVIGREFAFRILDAIAEMKEDLKSNLLNLQGLEFIYEKNLYPELEYIFRHALTQEVAYNSLLLKRRKEIHEKIGETIESLYAERLDDFYEMLAHHYSKGGNLEKAYRYNRLSGDKAIGKHSLLEAFRFHKEALSVLQRLPESEKNKRGIIETCLSMSTTMIFLGYPEDSLQILELGEKLCRETGDVPSLIRITAILSVYHYQRCSNRIAVEYGETAFQEAKKIQHIGLIAVTAVILCYAYFFMGRGRKVIELAPGVIEQLKRSNNESTFFGFPTAEYPTLCVICGLVYMSFGDFGKAGSFFQEALSSATRTNDLRTLMVMELFLSWYYLFKGNGKLAMRHGERFIQYAEESKWLTRLHSGWMLLGRAYYLLVELDKAEEMYKKGFEVQGKTGDQLNLSLFCCWRSETLLDLGDQDRAGQFAEKALRLSMEGGEELHQGLSRIVLGRMIGKSDSSRREQAELEIQRGVNFSENLGQRPYCAVGYLYLGELYADTGRNEEALENLKKAQSMFQEMGMDYWPARAREVLQKL